MKAVFLSYNQALTDRVNAIFDEQGIMEKLCRAWDVHKEKEEKQQH